MWQYNDTELWTQLVYWTIVGAVLKITFTVQLLHVSTHVQAVIKSQITTYKRKSYTGAETCRRKM